MRLFKAKVKLIPVLTVIFTLVFGFWAYAGRPGPGGSEISAPGELLVKFKSGKDSQAEVLEKVPGAKILQSSGLGVMRVKVPAAADTGSYLEKLNMSNDVEYAEPNYVYQASFIPDDPYYNKQWGLSKIEAGPAWDTNQGNAGVIVAVVDTGVDAGHPDLDGKIVEGFNTINENNVTMDENGHGTHVAGIAGASLNNGTGVAGIGGATAIMPVKVLDSGGSGYVADIAEGIVWAADHGARVINMSLGGNSYSATLAEAIDYAYGKGVLLVAAAGNSGREKISYPAGNNHVLGVSATSSSDALAYFSSFGSHVDLSAPGVDILSTYWYNGSTYAYLSGTSMASPFVAGLAGLAAAQFPDYTNDQIEKVLAASAADLGSPGWDKYYGYGRISANRAINAILDSAAPAVIRISDSPDPFTIGLRKTCSIYYTLTEGSVVTVEIVDANGKSVKVLENLRKASGSYGVKWDGKNSAGALVNAGIYTYTITAVDEAGNAGSGKGSIKVIRR